MQSHLSDLKTSDPIKKVLVIKTAPFKFLKKDKEGNQIPTQAILIRDHSTILGDTTDGAFNSLLNEPGSKRFIFKTKSPYNPTHEEEQIVTQEFNEMIVYKGIIFYKSSATSGHKETKRLNTWLPSLGLDDKSKRSEGSKEPSFKITKLETLYDKRFSEPDENLKKYEDYLGNDLMERLHNLDIMLMSAEIGGGFWETEEGRQLITVLKQEGILVNKGKVNIKPQAELEFKVPYEIKSEDDEFIANRTNEFNEFFKNQGGCLHNGLVSKERKSVQPALRDIYSEVCTLAKISSKNNRIWDAIKAINETSERNIDKKNLLISIMNLANRSNSFKMDYLLNLAQNLLLLDLDKAIAITVFREKFIVPACVRTNSPEQKSIYDQINKFNSYTEKFGAFFKQLGNGRNETCTETRLLIGKVNDFLEKNALKHSLGLKLRF